MRVRQDDQLNQLAMRETGLARLLYMGTDHAAIDFETPLTRAQQRVLEQFRASEGIDSFEYHDETGQMHTEDAHTGADAFAVVVLPEQWHGGLDMASVYEVWWDTSDTTAAMAWIQQEDNAREIRQDGHESVAVATLRLTDDAYDIEPRNWHILEESHELVEVPNVFIGEAFADQYGISELWPNRWAIPETPDEMIEELRDMLKDDDLNASTKGIIRDAISGAGMAKRGQVALDPAESVIGAIEGMLASGGLQWTQDTLNPLVSYAVVTPDDVARWVAAHEMSGSESTDTLSALTSNEGMQIIGDGLVLAGVAQIANVATADDGHVLVLWMESNDKS